MMIKAFDYNTSEESEKERKQKKKYLKIYIIVKSLRSVLLLARGGSSWPSQKYKLTHDFIVVHTKTFQKNVGDKPKSVSILLQRALFKMATISITFDHILVCETHRNMILVPKPLFSESRNSIRPITITLAPSFAAAIMNFKMAAIQNRSCPYISHQTHRRLMLVAILMHLSPRNPIIRV